MIPEDFLKQFNNGSELTSFIEQLHKRGIEKILEGELDSHSDKDKAIQKVSKILLSFW